jgi:uncharacterized protein (TIGR02996 family)
MSERDLEMRLLSNPDDAGTWLVYADALQRRGDPRGEVIVLGERIAQGDHSVDAQYAERCRAARWPRDAPFPRMHYRVRFEALFAELRARADLTIRRAQIAEPDLDALAHWRAIAGAAWPAGMTELYTDLSRVDLEWNGEDSLSGGIHIPPLRLWDHAALENELWFDFTEADSALHEIRPIDRFTPEAYTVLYLENPNETAKVAYHYCGESLVPIGVTYREWLELLFRSRGVAYWIQLATGPQTGHRSWVEEGIDQVAQMFPDFDPHAMSPATAYDEVPI